MTLIANTNLKNSSLVSKATEKWRSLYRKRKKKLNMKNSSIFIILWECMHRQCNEYQHKKKTKKKTEFKFWDNLLHSPLIKCFWENKIMNPSILPLAIG